MASPGAVKFVLAYEDMERFYLWYLKSSPAMKAAAVKRRLLSAAFGATAILVVGVLLAPRGGLFPYLVASAAAGIASYMIYPWDMRRQNSKLWRKLYREGANRGFAGRQTWQVEADGIRMANSVSETMRAWDGIERIVRLEGMTLLIIGAGMAYVISQREWIEGDYEAFVNEVERRWKAATS